MSRTLAVVFALAALLVAVPTPSPAHADPLYCVVIYDENGTPINTTCVPAPW